MELMVDNSSAEKIPISEFKKVTEMVLDLKDIQQRLNAVVDEHMANVIEGCVVAFRKRQDLCTCAFAHPFIPANA